MEWWPTRYRMNCIRSDLLFALKALRDTRVSDDSRISEEDDDAIIYAIELVQSAFDELGKLAEEMEEGVRGRWNRDAG